MKPLLEDSESVARPDLIFSRARDAPVPACSAGARLLSRTTQGNRLRQLGGVSEDVANQDVSGVESDTLWREGDGQRATTARRQAGPAIVCLEVVAFDAIANKVHSSRTWIFGVVEKRDRQGRTGLAHGQGTEIEAGTRGHSQRAWQVCLQLHGEPSTVDFAVPGRDASALQGIQLEKEIETGNQRRARLGHK